MVSDNKVACHSILKPKVGSLSILGIGEARRVKFSTNWLASTNWGVWSGSL